MFSTGMFMDNCYMEISNESFNTQKIVTNIKKMINRLIEFVRRQIARLNNTRKQILQKINIQKAKLVMRTSPMKVYYQKFCTGLAKDNEKPNESAQESALGNYYDKKIRIKKSLHLLTKFDETLYGMVIKFCNLTDQVIDAYEKNIDFGNKIANKVFSGAQLSDSEMNYIDKINSSLYDTDSSDIGEIFGVDDENGKLTKEEFIKATTNALAVLKKDSANFCKKVEVFGGSLSNDTNQLVSTLGGFIKEVYGVLPQLLSNLKETDFTEMSRLAVNFGLGKINPLKLVGKSAESALLIADVSSFLVKLTKVANLSYDIAIQLQSKVDKIPFDQEHVDQIRSINKVIEMLNDQAKLSPKKIIGETNATFKKLLKFRNINGVTG